MHDIAECSIYGNLFVIKICIEIASLSLGVKVVTQWSKLALRDT